MNTITKEVSVSHINTIGGAILFYRGIKHITQKQLANSVGISQAAISQIEQNDRKPKEDTLNKIAKTLELKPSDLIFGDYKEIVTKNLQNLSEDELRKVNEYISLLKKAR